MISFRSSLRICPHALATLTLAATAALAADTPPLPTVPARAEVLATMERAADWQLANPFTKFPPTEWINAAFYTGLVALSEISPSPRFHDAMVKIGEGNAWKLGPLPFHADDHCVGQSYVELYLRDKQPRMIAEMRKSFDYVLANPRDNNFEFDKEKNPTRLERWSWCDALFMSPPALLRLTAATGDERYRDFAIRPNRTPLFSRQHPRPGLVMGGLNAPPSLPSATPSLVSLRPHPDIF